MVLYSKLSEKEIRLETYILCARARLIHALNFLIYHFELIYLCK